MDSLTQAALGACVSAMCVPQEHRRKALLAGAMLGTLPDLDVLIDFGDAVSNFTDHRGFSHSLFVLSGVALIIWLALRRWWAPVRSAPVPWCAAIILALLTHALLDAHTAYGTQLWWPLDVKPTSWSTLFIIDPAFTLPLIVACIVVAGFSPRLGANVTLAVCLGLSIAYVGWTWTAKSVVEQNARLTLAEAGVHDPKLFSVPTPLNSLLWRIVILTDDGHSEAFDSLLVDEGGLRFTEYWSDNAALAEAANIHAVRRLTWFADGFVKASVIDDRLVIADLRMGQEPELVFRHVVAMRGDPHWQAIPPEQMRTMFGREAIAWTWRRLFDP